MRGEIKDRAEWNRLVKYVFKDKGENMTRQADDYSVEVQTQNLPLTDAQKVSVLTLQRKLVAVTAQHTDLTQKLQAALTKIAADNKIDVKSFMLNDDLDLIPVPPLN